MAFQVGNGKVGAQARGFKKRNDWKLKDGDQVYLILPAMGDPAENPQWREFHAVHFGYKNLEGKHRPFQSPLFKNKKTKMIEVPDAAQERLDDWTAKLAEFRKAGNSVMAQHMVQLVGQPGTPGVYNIDKNWHMNVMNLNGEIGVLRIRYKVMLDLKAEIDKLEADGVYPLSVDNGRWFKFSRSGLHKDTITKVTVYKEKIDVPGVGKVEREVVSKLSPETLNRLEREASNLKTLFPKITAEEVALIVKQSDVKTGKSAACDEIFDKRWKAAREARAAAKNGQTATVATTAQATASDEADDAPQPDAEEVAAQVTAAATVVVKPSETKTVTPVQPKVTQAQAIQELSDDDFFKMIGSPNPAQA